MSLCFPYAFYTPLTLKECALTLPRCFVRYKMCQRVSPLDFTFFLFVCFLFNQNKSYLDGSVFLLLCWTGGLQWELCATSGFLFQILLRWTNKEKHLLSLWLCGASPHDTFEMKHLIRVTETGWVHANKSSNKTNTYIIQRCLSKDYTVSNSRVMQITHLQEAGKNVGR